MQEETSVIEHSRYNEDIKFARMPNSPRKLIISVFTQNNTDIAVLQW